MMRYLTKDEIIAKYREALAFYADPTCWQGNRMCEACDQNRNDCSGLYLNNGEVARQALQINEGTYINERGTNA